MKCWGSNAFGQLGRSQNVDRYYRPGDVYGLRSGVRAIVIGSWSTACAVMRNGGAKCWGSNAYGMLGDSRLESDTDSAKPVDVRFGPVG